MRPDSLYFAVVDHCEIVEKIEKFRKNKTLLANNTIDKAKKLENKEN